MRLALGSNAPAAFLPAALATAILLPLTASAARGGAPPPANATHYVIASPPTGNDERDHQRLVDGEKAEQAAIEAGAEQTGPIAPLPPKFENAETPAEDPVDLFVFYGVLAALTLVGVAILYRYLAFRFSLDTAPDADFQEVSPPQPQAASVRMDPRPEQPKPAAPRAVPQLAPQARAPKIEAAKPPASARQPERAAQPAASPPASEDQLQGKASKMLSSTNDWMTVGGIAQALQADEWTTAKVLENLVDSGQVQEAKAQNGQTVYRYAR
jgi:hypothetical protein